jgi:lantibiotic modifying enzyme
MRDALGWMAIFAVPATSNLRKSCLGGVTMKSMLLVVCLLCSTVSAAISPVQTHSETSRPIAASDFDDLAREAARWIASTKSKQPSGEAWPNEAESPQVVSTDVSTGVAGTLLFFLALERAGAKEYRGDIRSAADYLVATLPAKLDLKNERTSHSLYGGVAGVGFALHEAFKATGEVKYRDASNRASKALQESLTIADGKATWGPGNDILFGSSGAALYLLYMAREAGNDSALKAARQVAEGLLARAEVIDGGLTWKVAEDSKFTLPNFSHGAAGIGYFFAVLFEQTKDRKYLEAAIKAARYLESVAEIKDGVFVVTYGTPAPDGGWRRPFDLGWAHGTAGTARLFHKLFTITGEKHWHERVLQCAKTIENSGMPDKLDTRFGPMPFETDMRFGIASIADFFLSLYAETGTQAYKQFARRLVTKIASTAIRDSKGARWQQPRYVFMENAGKPVHFTGYFYGAAGYGYLMLRMAAADKNRDLVLPFPDNPFASKAPNGK